MERILLIFEIVDQLEHRFQMREVLHQPTKTFFTLNSIKKQINTYEKNNVK